MVSTRNEGRKFFYYVYQYEASDLLGAWRDSQIYVKWDTKKIDKAYRLSATEVTKDAEGDGYTINMSLVGTPVAPYLKRSLEGHDFIAGNLRGWSFCGSYRRSAERFLS